MSKSDNLVTEVSPLLEGSGQHGTTQKKKTNRTLVYTYSIIAAVGGFITGYDTGSISSIVALPLFQKRFFLHNSLAYYESLLLASYLVTATIGAVSSGYFCDGIGRKNSMSFASFLLSTGIIIEIAGYNATTLVIGRLISGLGTGIMTNAIPLYQSEIAPSDIRGRLISIFSLLGAFGQMVGYFVTFYSSHFSTDWNWRTPWLVQLTVLLIFTLSLTWIPYSPRWLIDKGRDTEALQVLSLLHNLPSDDTVVQKEFTDIQTLVLLEREKNQDERNYRELFEGNHLKRTMYSFFISVATCFTGNVIIAYYAPKIFKNAGFSDISTSLALTGGMGFLSLVFTALSLGWWIDVWGRKAIFYTGSAISAICMMTMGTVFQLDKLDTYGQWIIIACVYVFSASFAGTWGVGNYVYTAEVFSMRCRARGLSLTYAISWLCCILITYSVPFFFAYSISGVYYFFGVCSIITFIGIAFIPETKGKTLEELDFMFEHS